MAKVIKETETGYVSCYIKDFARNLSKKKIEEWREKRCRQHEQTKDIDIEYNTEGSHKILRFYENGKDDCKDDSVLVSFNKIDFDRRGIILDDGRASIRFYNIFDDRRIDVVYLVVYGGFCEHETRFVTKYGFFVNDETADKIFDKLKSIIISEIEYECSRRFIDEELGIDTDE